MPGGNARSGLLVRFNKRNAVRWFIASTSKIPVRLLAGNTMYSTRLNGTVVGLLLGMDVGPVGALDGCDVVGDWVGK